jgi:hypothetical protein
MEIEGETCVSTDKDGDGIPNALDKCPTEPEDKDGFEDEDGCPDPDNDGDGIPDAMDKCPNAAEDKNNYKDDDGCPDAKEVAALAAEEQERKRQEEAAAAQVLADESARRQREQEETDRQERAAREAKKKEEDEKAASSRATRRTIGAGLMIGGGAFGVVSVVAMGLGGAQNSKIQGGGFSTGKDITDAASQGRTYNGLAIGTGVVAICAEAVGVPLWFVNREPQSPAPTVSLGPGRIAIQGRF